MIYIHQLYSSILFTHAHGLLGYNSHSILTVYIQSQWFRKFVLLRTLNGKNQLNWSCKLFEFFTMHLINMHVFNAQCLVNVSESLKSTCTHLISINNFCLYSPNWNSHKWNIHNCTQLKHWHLRECTQYVIFKHSNIFLTFTFHTCIDQYEIFKPFLTCVTFTHVLTCVIVIVIHLPTCVTFTPVLPSIIFTHVLTSEI